MDANTDSTPKVVLICMPWATTIRPSLALGILSRICAEEDVTVTTLYPNMDMTAAIGFEASARLADERALYGLSEHLFACDIFGAELLSSDEYLDVLLTLKLKSPFQSRDFILELRDRIVGRFLDQTQERVLAEQPTVVGFSSTFNQVMGSLALAKRLKRLRPEVQVILGGACFDGEMGQEYHRVFSDFIDHVFMAEADESFREYLRRHKVGMATTGIPGVTSIQSGRVHLVPGSPLHDMNQSPLPDYDSFFLEKHRMQKETGLVFNVEYLPFESSRGCWWGQKNHCVFCGINTDLMPFREKDIDRVISEMVALTSRYRTVRLTAADWIISRKSRSELFQRLADLDLDIECFYETRADLSKKEFALMRRAGILTIQPGIESFSTELLRLMKKGTRRIHHVQFMRWAREFGIHLSYNIIAGFPGEQVEWYLEMSEFLPKIIHLQPPLHNMHWVEMHRFSPLFERRQEFGVDDYQIREDYGFNFPPDFVDLQKIGYFFSFKASTLAEREAYAPRVREVVSQWIEAHENSKHVPKYFYRLGPSFLRVEDNRTPNGRVMHLANLHQDVFLLCDKVQTITSLKELLTPLHPDSIGSGRLEEIVEELISEDLVYREDGFLLSLPIGFQPRTTEDLYTYVLGDMVKPGSKSGINTSRSIPLLTS